MPTTSNFGWTTPADTDLVKDGAAAIRSLGTSIDTTTKALNPSTTLGDIEYRSSTANTNTRLGIGTSGQVLTVVGGVPAWTTVSNTPSFSGAQVYASATSQSIANATFTILSFDKESYDTNSYHNNSTNNSRLTIPTTGYYNLAAYVTFAGNTSGGRAVQIYKNGTTVVQDFSGNYALGSSSDMAFFCSINVNATAGDYFEIRVRQSSGGSLGVLGLNSTQYTFFQAQSLGA